MQNYCVKSRQQNKPKQRKGVLNRSTTNTIYVLSTYYIIIPMQPWSTHDQLQCEVKFFTIYHHFVQEPESAYAAGALRVRGTHSPQHPSSDITSYEALHLEKSIRKRRWYNVYPSVISKAHVNEPTLDMIYIRLLFPKLTRMNQP